MVHKYSVYGFSSFITSRFGVFSFFSALSTIRGKSKREYRFFVDQLPFNRSDANYATRGGENIVGCNTPSRDDGLGKRRNPHFSPSPPSYLSPKRTIARVCAVVHAPSPPGE